MPEPKKLDIAEFQQLGLLAEVNRRFYHPIGLAQAIWVPEPKDGVAKYCPWCGADYADTGHDDDCADPKYVWSPYSLAYIIDNRDDPEGFIFAGMNQTAAATQAHYYDMEVTSRHAARERLFQKVRPDFVRLRPDGIQPLSTVSMTIDQAKGRA